jgi:NAD(P)-dependent dehydrogenase (short-subunit alcohol dehydrogenase family)
MSDPFLLKGKTIFITGASSGIGRATAIECSKLGARLIITGRDENRLSETFSLLNGTDHDSFIADLTDSDRIDTIVNDLPQLDGCSFNAGINKPLPIQFIRQSDLSDTFQINTFIPILFTRLLAKNKKFDKGASIVFTSSIAGIYRSSMANSIYSASKGALNGFMKNAALELAVKGIRVNSVNPGMVQTEMLGKGVISQEQYLSDRKSYPLQRYGTPQEIAYSIIFLLSDASAWITGTNLVIDGGVTLR